mgnify:CR=1 FL=1
MYAIIQDSGKEFKVTKGEVLDIDRKKLNPGDPITFEKVKLVHDGEKLHASPESAVVEATVMDHPKGRKQTVMKFRRRKNSKTKNGFRKTFTRIKVDDIKC